MVAYTNTRNPSPTRGCFYLPKTFKFSPLFWLDISTHRIDSVNLTAHPVNNTFCQAWVFCLLLSFLLLSFLHIAHPASKSLLDGLFSKHGFQGCAVSSGGIPHFRHSVFHIGLKSKTCHQLKLGRKASCFYERGIGCTSCYYLS